MCSFTFQFNENKTEERLGFPHKLNTTIGLSPILQAVILV